MAITGPSLCLKGNEKEWIDYLAFGFFAVLGAAVASGVDTQGVECSANHVVSHTRKVTNSATTHQHDGVFLQVVAFATDDTPSLHCRWKDGPGKPFEKREFGFLGVTVRTWRQTPRRCGQFFKSRDLEVEYCCSRGRRMSWLVVGIKNLGSCPDMGRVAKFSGSRAMGQGLHRPPQLLPIASSTPQ